MTRIMNEIERERERTRMRHPRHPEKGTKRCLTSCAPRCTAFLGETNTHNLMCDSPLAVTLSHCDCPPKTLLEVASSPLLLQAHIWTQCRFCEQNLLDLWLSLVTGTPVIYGSWFIIDIRSSTLEIDHRNFV